MIAVIAVPDRQEYRHITFNDDILCEPRNEEEELSGEKNARNIPAF